MKPKELAILFHTRYETFAPAHGYETRDDTKVFDSESKNGKLMVSVCASLLSDLLIASESEIQEAFREWYAEFVTSPQDFDDVKDLSIDEFSSRCADFLIEKIKTNP